MRVLSMVLFFSITTTGLFAAMSCVPSNDEFDCRLGSTHVHLFRDDSSLPTRLRSGRLYPLPSDAPKGVQCFIDDKRGEMECTIPEGSGGAHHLYGKIPPHEVAKALRAASKISQKEKAASGNRVTTPPVSFQAVSVRANGVVTPRQPSTPPPSQGKGLASHGSTTTPPPPSISISSFPAANRLEGDIDGDGRVETVAWKKFARTELGDYYQLFLFDDDGRLLWQGPRVADSDNRYIFGSWDFGESLPEALVDVDGDGQAELLAPAPSSDISPIYYRIFGWNGHSLVSRRPAVLLHSTDRPGRFSWVNPAPENPVGLTWVSRIHSGHALTEAKAEVTAYRRFGSPQTGEALLRFDSYGAQVLSWNHPIPKPQSRGYRARISIRDHYNSRGRRLHTLHEILRQDRAYYYRGAGDPEDSGSGRFSTLRERARMESMVIVPLDSGYRRLERAILYGTPLIEVIPVANRLEVKLIAP